MYNGTYVEFTTISCDICNQFFTTGEDGSRIRRMAGACSLSTRHKVITGEFNHSVLIHVPRTEKKWQIYLHTIFEINRRLSFIWMQS